MFVLVFDKTNKYWRDNIWKVHQNVLVMKWRLKNGES